jgi:ubiquinone/menaquinone biosynthesis C-methylase UbiE
MHEKIKKHWDDLAETNKSSYKASWDDYYMLQKEIEEVGYYIHEDASVCDMGCNNGYCDFELLKKFGKINITGIDFSEKAIEEANKTREDSPYKYRCEFLVGNILDTSTYPDKKFDRIIVKRTLINLTSDEEQLQAIHNLFSIMKYEGEVLLLEAVEENLQKLNKLRLEFGLPLLDQPWHNRYLNKNVVDKLHSNFNVCEDRSYSSSYYIMSRVLYPWMSSITPGTKIDYLSEINRLATMLPNIGDYGIQRLFVLSKKP